MISLSSMALIVAGGAVRDVSWNRVVAFDEGHEVLADHDAVFIELCHHSPSMSSMYWSMSVFVLIRCSLEA